MAWRRVAALLINTQDVIPGNTFLLLLDQKTHSNPATAVLARNC
jgi:hypothetical protein